jgi:hypothetical protein
MAMAEIYEKDRPSIQEYTSHFRLIDSQVGAVLVKLSVILMLCPYL